MICCLFPAGDKADSLSNVYRCNYDLLVGFHPRIHSWRGEIHKPH